MRGALGGSRVVLICEQMTESLLICLAGGALGLLLSLASTYWLAAHWRNLPRAESVHVDGWVLTFTLALVLAAARSWPALCPPFRPPEKGCFRDCAIPRERWAAAPPGRGCARRC